MPSRRTTVIGPQSMQLYKKAGPLIKVLAVHCRLSIVVPIASGRGLQTKLFI